MSGLTIPHDVAEQIALASLKDQHQYLTQELKAHIEEGQWLHPEDVSRNYHLIHALDTIIKYYGG